MPDLVTYINSCIVNKVALVYRKVLNI